MQRTPGAGSPGEVQKGIIFTAALKLVVPFIMVVPEIAVFNLIKPEMAEAANPINNQQVLEAFESVRADPSAGGTVFRFNAEFCETVPQTLQRAPTRRLDF